MLAELTILLILLGVSVHVPKRMVHLTRAAAIMILFSSIIYSVENWLGNQEVLSVWRYVLTYANYSLLPVILIVIIEISAPMSKKMLWLLIPEALNVVLCVTSPWTALVCTFSAENEYIAGILSRLPYFVFVFYVVVFFIQSVIRYKNYPLRDRLSLLAILVVSMIGVLMYIVFDISSDYSAIFTSCILLYYLFLYIHLAKVDPLTGMLNRQCFYRDSITYVRKITAVVSVDMNELKWINDNKGHEAGDEAIRTVAKCLTENVGLHKMAYRVGGDEFVILYFSKHESSILTDINKMREILRKTPYTCAFGYSMHAPGEKLDAALRLADEAMYANKAAIKKAVRVGGGEVHDRSDDWFL